MANEVPADFLDLLSDDEGIGQAWQEVPDIVPYSAPRAPPISANKEATELAAIVKNRLRNVKYQKTSRAKRRLIQKTENRNAPTPHPPLLSTVDPAIFIQKGMRFQSRKESILMVKAVCEKTNNIIKQTKKDLSYKATTVGTLGPYQNHLEYVVKYNKESKDWVVIDYTPPSPGIGAEERNESLPTCQYSAENLSILVESQLRNNPAVSGGVLRVDIKPYVRLPLSRKMLTRVKQVAFTNCFSTESENMQFIEAYVDALSDVGHEAKVEWMTGRFLFLCTCYTQSLEPAI